MLAQLTKRLIERAMEVELTDHVGYEPHQEPPGGAENQSNGTSPKTVICEHGKVQIDAPRDRDSSFQPRIVKKRQRRFQSSRGSRRRSWRSTAVGSPRATSARTCTRSTVAR